MIILLNVSIVMATTLPTINLLQQSLYPAVREKETLRSQIQLLPAGYDIRVGRWSKQNSLQFWQSNNSSQQYG